MASASKLDRYRYISDLGRGGMSHVVLAQDNLLDRRVALKRMNAGDDAQALLRLRREALIGASVSHPNLVSIYDIVAAGGGEYVIVMEYVEGETLREALSGGQRLPVPRALSILDGVASGLDAIHAQRVVHRDVKPGNVLLGADGVVKLSDLGIASAPDRTRITMEGAILGTLSYIAPEQLEGKPVTPATDVYALAAVAYEALSGRKARPEPNAVALAHAIATRPPPDLREAWPEATATAAQLICRAMATEPDSRPGSATELARGLRDALEMPVTVPLARPSAAASSAPSERARRRAELVRQSRAAAARRAAARTAAASPGVGAPAPARPSREGLAPQDRRGADGAAYRAGVRPRRRRRVALGLLLGVLLLAGATAALLAATGGTRRPQTAANRPSRRSAGRSPAARRHASSTAHASTTTIQTPSTNAAPSNTRVTGGPSSPSQPPPAGSASTPVGAAETFYSLAASHRYAQAWALADPTFRDQLGGYPSFENGQALDRSIIFDSARVVSRTADAAKIAVRTTSVRANGTQHCTGTVDLERSSATWLLHLIHINCV